MGGTKKSDSFRTRPAVAGEKGLREKREHSHQGLEGSILKAIRRLWRDEIGRGKGRSRDIDFDLKFTVKADGPWEIDADPSLEEQIRHRLMEVAARQRIFQAGRLYCYRCESSTCGHSVPPEPGHVFGGYTSTGLPQWIELTQLFLQLRHPRLDLVYQSPGRHLAAAFQDGATLRGSQLKVFGRHSRTYDILAQVVFGYLRLSPPGAEEGETDLTAFTLQAVEIRGGPGRSRIVLNIIGRLRDGTPAYEALADRTHLRVLRALMEARRTVEGLSPAAAGRPKGVSERRRRIIAPVHQVLRKTVRSLDRLGAQTGRRTAHAEKRSSDSRPTAKAVEDAAAAPAERLLWDERRQTVVVLGPRNRVHVFNPRGRHVTSLNLTGEAVKARRRRERWKQLEGDLLHRFRSGLVRKR